MQMRQFEFFGAVTYSLRFAFILVYSTFKLPFIVLTLPIVSYLHTLPSLETQAFPFYACIYSRTAFLRHKCTLKWGSEATHFPASQTLLLSPISLLSQTLVCHSQHTYFYSHSVLQSLSGTSQLTHFRRWLGQEIHREALLRSAHILREVYRLLSPWE